MKQKKPRLLDHNSIRRWTLIAMILASGIVFLDSSVVNVALPTIGQSLGTGLSGLQWIVNGYVLTLATLLIIGGSLADRYGRRRALLVGLTGFGVTSIACGLAPSIPWLIGSRMLQGMTGALLVPGSLAIIRDVFEAGQARGQAIGRWSGWAGITTVIGPLLGGWLVDNLSWRWVFFINVPIIALTVWLLFRYVPTSRDEQASQQLDWAGAGLLIAGLGGLTYGLIQGPVLGWSSFSVLAGLVIGAISLLSFPFREAWTPEPMVPLALFRSRNFSGANLTTLGVYFALYGTIFFLVIYVQNVMGYSALMAGLMLAPISLIMLVLSPQVGKLAGQYGARLFMSLGPLIIAVGLWLLSQLAPDANIWTELIPAVSVFGVGLAGTVAPLTDTVVSSVGEKFSGVAAAFNNVLSRTAALLAIAILGVVVSFTFELELEKQVEELSISNPASQNLQKIAQDPTGPTDTASLPPKAERAANRAYAAAFQWAMLVSAAVAAAAGLVAWAMIRDRS